MPKKAPKIIPRAKQVLVLADEEESRISEHGLVTPTNQEQEKKAFGTVIAVGADISDIKKGSRVIYGAYTGETIMQRESTGKETEYKLLHDEDVLAFLED